jgi:hypothetical protein
MLSSISARVIAVDGHLLPSRRSKPFIFGVYQGEGEPEVNAFFCDAKNELNRLHPSTNLSDNETRGVTIEIRAIIGDAPARCWLCGVKYFSGFYACCRCKSKGAHPYKKVIVQAPAPLPKNRTKNQPKKPPAKKTNEPKEYTYVEMTTVKYPTIGHPPRVHEEWDSYWELPDGETDPKMIHRTGPTPLDRIIGINPIKQVVLELMHVLDGGVYKDVLALALKMNLERNPVSKRRGKNAPIEGSKKVEMTSVTPMKYRSWNVRIRVWSKYTPKEFGRKLTSLDYVKTWKMNQHAQMFHYYLPALARLDELHFEAPKRDLVLHLIRAARLINKNVNKPVPQEDIQESRFHFAAAFKLIHALSKGSACTIKVHYLIHLADDVLNIGFYAGTFSGYPYENQLVHFRHLGLTGYRVIYQIANRLMERGHLHEDLDEEDTQQCNHDEETIESFMTKVMRNRTSSEQTVTDLLAFPPFFVHDFNEKRQVVTCESFTVTNKFPDNVVRLHYSTKTRRERNAFAISEIFRDSDDGQIKIRAREFVNLRSTFQKPFPSSKIGNFEGEHEAKNTNFKFEVFPFARILGKFFCFPKFLDGRKTFDPLDLSKRQGWILQEIGHSEAF